MGERRRRRARIRGFLHAVTAVVLAAAGFALAGVVARAQGGSGPLDGTWSAEFTVSVSSNPLANPGQKLTGLEFTVRGTQISGDLTGSVNLTLQTVPTLSSPVYLATVSSEALGSGVSCQGEIYFVVDGAGYVGTRYTDSITCNGDTIEGTLDGYRVNAPSTTESTPPTTGETTSGGTSDACVPPPPPPVSEASVAVTFSNDSGGEVLLYTILPAGDVIMQRRVPAGETATISSDAGYTFWAKTNAGDCLGSWLLTTGTNVIHIPPPPTQPTQPATTQTQPTTTTAPKGFGIDWTMPPRLSAARMRLWATAGYGLPPAAYVDPPRWQLTLFVTNGCPAGYSYRWQLQGQGLSEQLAQTGCRVETTVPKLGAYQVTATQLQGGAATGAVGRQRVVVRDWLIVGLGDSNGSGEGNPPWVFAQCDRSLASSQYRFAQYLEDHDARSSVTFAFASCSGARLEHLWQDRYAGIQPKLGPPLPPQLTQVQSRLGKRRPDAVIVSAGINNIRFSSLMKFCFAENAAHALCAPRGVREVSNADGSVSYWPNPLSRLTLAQATTAQLALLHSRYAALAARLSQLRWPAKHVFPTEYPDFARDATGALCSERAGPMPRFYTQTWTWLEQTGYQLNARVDATRALGWAPVAGIAHDFRTHGYCSTASYFVPLTDAMLSGNADGAFHASPAGQQVTLEHTIGTVCKALYGNIACDGKPPAP